MSEGSNPLDLLHLLLIPLSGVLLWLLKKLDMKADKIDLTAAIKSMEETITRVEQTQEKHHLENTRRLDNIHKTQLDIVGGRYDRTGRER